MKLLSEVIFSSWPSKTVNLNFPNYRFCRNKDKFNRCLKIQSKMAARISICTLNPFKINFKSNSYLTSFPRRGAVTLSTPFFPNIIVTKAIENLFVVSKITEHSNNLYIHLYTFDIIQKSSFLFDATFLLWPRKYVNSNFWQYQL